jgi:hypothetical protein
MQTISLPFSSGPATLVNIPVTSERWQAEHTSISLPRRVKLLLKVLRQDVLRTPLRAYKKQVEQTVAEMTP